MKRLLTNRGWGALQSPPRRAVNGLNLHPIGSWSAVQRLPKCRLPGYPSAGSQRFLPSGGPKTGHRTGTQQGTGQLVHRTEHRTGTGTDCLSKRCQSLLSQFCRRGKELARQKGPFQHHTPLFYALRTPRTACQVSELPRPPRADEAGGSLRSLAHPTARCLWISQTSKRLRRSTTLRPRARPQVRFPNA